MSHFTTLQTTIKNIEALHIACRELGLELVQEGQARGYQGHTVYGDYVIKCKGPYDVVLNKQQDGQYALVTDWYQGHVAKEIGDSGGRLLQTYGVVLATMEARKLGYTVSRQSMPDGSVKVVLTQAASGGGGGLK
ncbi:DUF1257 domain-containing protein [Paenibacillus sp. WQ 127069]|uniref:DUF1257 domain-containing protein n=1 Tax=Paenibacillus baimaensis TaxID=2982185 RepID=A0ABT2UH62_9BACL|nr:DUF1257 domain-containing protein [Paenibacillus sp. WQ 127069]MCU6793227.1 DUF1257 domain-containing protein [Paenibacillus sp. WQ 127069]